MIRFLLISIFIFHPIIYAKTSINGRIKKTSNKLKRFDRTYSKIHKNFALTAKEIIKQEQKILKEQKKLQKLRLELSLKEQRYQENIQELKTIKYSQQQLKLNQEQLRRDLAFMLAKNISLSLIIDDEKAKNSDSLIAEEVFESLNKITHKNISTLQKDFSSNSKKIKSIQLKIDYLKKAIAEIDNKHREILTITKTKKAHLKKLKEQKKRYRASIKKLLKQQSSLKNELAKLNIIKEDEKTKRAAKRKERLRLAKLKKMESLRAVPNSNLPRVKSHAESMTQTVKTKTYRGKKTISPLDDYTVVKKYGPYEDPIYHIKIFNESISLKPKRSNAKVKNVFNGKVILAKTTALLNNIVIIEHDNGIHTIYAHLDKLAPTIKKGKRLKRGSIIGRVNNELMFEVTQRNYHINPLQLIAKR